jgi:nucleoside-diphosphate-sugar epimerase
MKVLCTGTTGFIGRQLAPLLSGLDHDVYCLERHVSGRYTEGGRKQLKTMFADLNDHFAIRNLIRAVQPQAIIHLAALTPVAFSYERPYEALQTNFVATVNLAETAMREDDNLKQFIFAGTSECYGNQTEFPIKESARFHPNSPYGVSKVAAVEYLRYMHAAYSFPVTMIFPFNSYGRGNSKHFVVERILSQMLNGEKEVRLGDPEPVRDFVYLSDHVDGYVKALNHPKAIGETFNICTGQGVKISELAEKCAEITDYQGDIVWGTIPARPLDIYRLIGDNTKARDVLGWRQNVSLDEGLQLTIEGLKENG